MNIVNTTTTHTAIQITANGEFNIDYTIVNGALSRVQVTVKEKEAGESGEKMALGYINYEHRTINCNFSDQVKLSLLLGDFERFLEQIRQSLEKESE